MALAYIVLFLLMLLCCILDVVKSVKLTDFIKYYEPVRIISIMYPQSLENERSVLAELYAFNRTFTFSANFGKSAVVSPDAQIEVLGNDNITIVKVPIRNYLSRLVEGTLSEDPLSEVYGTLYDGVLNGVIRTNGVVYYIEPASKYFKKKWQFNSIMYRSSDVDMEKQLCSGPDRKYLQGYRKAFILGPFVNQSLPIRRNFKTKAKKLKHVVPSDTMEDQDYHSEEPAGSMKNEVCLLKLVADHKFFQKVGKNDFHTSTEEMILLVREANQIFQSLAFQIGKKNRSEMISLSVKNIFVHKSEFEPNYRLYDNMLTAEAFLQNMSEDDFSNYCLGVGFTFRTFKKRVLGLAYLADPDPAGTLGGICQERKYIPFRYKAMSYNVAFISVGREGRILPRIINVLSLAHELGHSFGAHHDPDEKENECGGGKDGRFLMSAQAVSGRYSNNRLFSPCSKRDIGLVYMSKSASCFRPVAPVCGNGIPEDFEECDCGHNFQCTEIDNCCTPMGGIGKDAECTYRRQEGMKCTPVKDPCCTTACKVVIADIRKICSDIDSCTEEAYCDGVSAQCPKAPLKMEWEPCIERTGVCQQGVCVTNVCKIKQNLNECECSEPEFQCLKCCQINNTSCRPAHESGILSTNGLSVLRPKGTLCQQGTNKVCTAVGDCVDPFIGLRDSMVAKKTSTEEPEAETGTWSTPITILVVLVIALIVSVCICLVCWIIPFRSSAQAKIECEEGHVCEIDY